VQKAISLCGELLREIPADLCRGRVVDSVSKSRSRDVPTSRLGLGRQMSRSRPFMSRAQDQFSDPTCTGHNTQCERALDVVSLCCSYYCLSY